VLSNDTPSGATIASYGASSGTEQTSIGASTPTSSGGTVVLQSNGSFVYTPLSGFNGPDSFKYRLTNPLGTATATVTINVGAAPSAVDDTYATPANTPLSQAGPGVTSNDTTSGATVVSYGAVSGAEQSSVGAATATNAGGTVSMQANGAFTYTPAGGYSGSDSFKYRISNALGGTTATVTIRVGPPAAVNDSYSTSFNVQLVTPNAGVLTNDNLNGGSIASYGATGTEQTSIGASTATAHGTVSVQAGGGFTYTPANGFTGDDSFVYRLQNPNGSVSATVGIGVGVPPVANDDAYPTALNTPLVLAAPGALSNDSVIGASVVSYGATTGNEQTSVGIATPTASGGSISIQANGGFTYVPLNAFQGTDIFKYKIQNGKGSSTATVIITVGHPPQPVNDAYDAHVDIQLDVTAPGVLANDALSGAVIVSYGANGGEQTTIGGPAPTQQGGTLVLTSGGGFTYMPAPGFFGPDQVRYVVQNPYGPVSATVFLNVLPPD
jgi:hypothetical protein